MNEKMEMRCTSANQCAVAAPRLYVEKGGKSIK
jgi:hypothetical protein